MILCYRCAKYLDMLVDMDTSVDLLPDEEIAALTVKAIGTVDVYSNNCKISGNNGNSNGSSIKVSPEEETSPVLSFQTLLIEWNSVLARSLNGTQDSNDTDKKLAGGLGSFSDIGVDGNDKGGNSFSSKTALGSPTARSRPLLLDGNSVNNAHVAKKSHLMLFNKSASRWATYA